MKDYSNNQFPGLGHEKGLPRPDFTHIRILTDDTGILQHATYSIPNREHGYCVDDNARALVVACDACRLGMGESLRDRVPVYLSFVIHAFNRENGRFRNFMSYDRQWREEAGSEDSHGRAIWGLGAAAACAPLAPQRELAALVLERAVEAVNEFTSPRALAFTILGLDRYLDGAPGNRAALEAMASLARRLQNAFTANSREGWRWPEDILSYSNGMLPLALLMAGERLDDQMMLSTALGSLEWLVELQTAPEGHLSIVGNNGWYVRNGERARFDQQPIDAAAIVLASLRALKVTGAPVWRDRALMAFGWFLGRNDLGAPLHDADTGGCRDGLESNGANANQGAESTVEWLLARLAVEEMADYSRRAHLNRASRQPETNGLGKRE
jgi:hypothetical protein